ncbi:MAG: hypothetical protein K2G88_01205, partial [Oscillospiraceae bacterium]|nr:hypothetical protein [Oscillospiraceae bacterium]
QEQSAWRYEVISMLQNRSINDCTDKFFCFRPLSEEEQAKIENDESYKAIAKNECSKRSFFKYLDTDHDIYGYIDEENYDNVTYGVTVFAAPPRRKEFKCVLGFDGFRTLIGARLALAILFIMMDSNGCSITRMHSDTLNKCIESQGGMGFILGTYRTIDDRYHFAVTANEHSDGTFTYNTYYFKKKRVHFEQIGRDFDFPHLTRALACLTTEAKVSSGELEIEDDDDFLFFDLDDRFC